MRMSIASHVQRENISPPKEQYQRVHVKIVSKESFKASEVKVVAKSAARENIWMKPRLLVTTVKNALLGDSVTRMR